VYIRKCTPEIFTRLNLAARAPSEPVGTAYEAAHISQLNLMGRTKKEKRGKGHGKENFREAKEKTRGKVTARKESQLVRTFTVSHSDFVVCGHHNRSFTYLLTYLFTYLLTMV